MERMWGIELQWALCCNFFWPHRAWEYVPGVVSRESCASHGSILHFAWQLAIVLRQCDACSALSSFPSMCVESCAAVGKNFHSLSTWKLHESKHSTVVVSLTRWTFPIQLLNWRKSWGTRRGEKKKKNIPSCCDNHNSHMFHSVDFRLLRLMSFLCLSLRASRWSFFFCSVNEEKERKTLFIAFSRRISAFGTIFFFCVGLCSRWPDELQVEFGCSVIWVFAVCFEELKGFFQKEFCSHSLSLVYFKWKM